MNSGEINNRINRVKQHFTTLTFIQVSALTIDRWGWQWWYLLFPIALIIFSQVDTKKIFPKELDYIYKSSPLFMRMYDKIIGEDDQCKKE